MIGRRLRGLLAGVLAGMLLAGAAAVVAWRWPHPVRPVAGEPAPSHAASSGPAQPHWPSYLPSPGHRMLLGTYTSLAGQRGTEAAIARREAAMGHRFSLQATYYAWHDRFPDFGEAAIVAHGRTPFMTWFGPARGNGALRVLTSISSGRYDALILRQAEAIKRFRQRIYLRLMPEMNDTWYRGYSGHPAAYIAAWRHVHRLFSRAGAGNVVWVWCPNLGPHDWDRYYPGNAYVDVIGVDGFNNPANMPWRSFEQMFSPFLRHYAGRKPLMIAETATNSLAGGAARFIQGMHAYLKMAGPRYGVIALCWFDSNTSGGSYDWRLDQTPAAWRAWLALARDPYFGGHG
jgi:Glycosyl hydrolase family 26